MIFGFGISNVFALPFAVGIDDDDGERSLTLWVGPFFFEIAWQA